MSPDLEVQGLVVQTLKADAAVTALVAGRVFDQVPKDAQFPYVSYGPSDVVEDDADCIDGLLVTFQIDAWSRTVGFPECKRITDAVRRALHQRDLPLGVNALVYLQHEITRTQRDPDGLTSHGIMTFEASVEQTP